MAMGEIERLLVDFFDLNGFPPEKDGADWFLRIGEGEVNLTGLASALAALVSKS